MEDDDDVIGTFEYLDGSLENSLNAVSSVNRVRERA